MNAEDIEGLTPLEIQNKFALPNTPQYVSDVELNVGTHLRVGEVNPLEGWGAGGESDALEIFIKKGEIISIGRYCKI